MAQKRNPVSLRLQTRLQGNEKRFASCWFTDRYFSQVYTNDLARRLYLGVLLHKVGSWYSEKSESCIPETCVSIQFLYRRCFMLSVVLDKRKEEYLLSTSPKGSDSRRERITVSSLKKENNYSFFARPSKKGLCAAPVRTQLQHSLENAVLQFQESFKKPLLSKTRVDNVSLNLNNKNILFSKEYIREKQAFLKKSLPLDLPKDLCNTALLFPGTQKEVCANKTSYLSIANFFGANKAQHKHRASIKNQFCTSVKTTDKRERVDMSTFSFKKYKFQRGWKDWLCNTTAFQYNIISDSESVSTVESICDLSQEQKSLQPQNEILHKQIKANIKSIVEKGYSDNIFRSRPLFTPASYWSSYSLIRGVSIHQNVEFCLYFIKFLYKKRFSFLQIKDALFRMLATNEKVRGARLTCSGRQGGRSKSAMRAKKQSALWGQTALSLFSSRLAFASANVDTSFGHTGIKVWICYK